LYWKRWNFKLKLWNYWGPVIPGECRWCSERLWAEQCDVQILAKVRYFSVFQNVLTL
jgi:hypothetical protein